MQAVQQPITMHSFSLQSQGWPLQQGQITASSLSSSEESDLPSSTMISAIFSSMALISSFTISSFPFLPFSPSSTFSPSALSPCACSASASLQLASSSCRSDSSMLARTCTLQAQQPSLVGVVSSSRAALTKLMKTISQKRSFSSDMITLLSSSAACLNFFSFSSSSSFLTSWCFLYFFPASLFPSRNSLCAYSRKQLRSQMMSLLVANPPSNFSFLLRKSQYSLYLLKLKLSPLSRTSFTQSLRKRAHCRKSQLRFSSGQQSFLWMRSSMKEQMQDSRKKGLRRLGLVVEARWFRRHILNPRKDSFSPAVAISFSQSLQKVTYSSKQLPTFLLILAWKYSQKWRQYSATSKSCCLSGCFSYLRVRKCVNSLPKQQGSFWYSLLLFLRATQSAMLNSFVCWTSDWQQAAKQLASRSMKASSWAELMPEARLNSALRCSHSGELRQASLQAFPTRRSWFTSSALQSGSEKEKTAGISWPFWMARRQRYSPIASGELLKISKKRGEEQRAACTTVSRLRGTPRSPPAMAVAIWSWSLAMRQKLANWRDSSKGVDLWVASLPPTCSVCRLRKQPRWQMLTGWKQDSLSQTRNSLRQRTVSPCIQIKCTQCYNASDPPI